LLIDDDPQGSLTLWNELRADAALPIKIVKRGIGHIVKKAARKCAVASHAPRGMYGKLR
jgi:hypothetical protein